MKKQRFPELGFYTLPGHALAPTAVFEEVASGDELGLGSVWISERFNTKDIGVISGIAAARTPNMGIASGLIGNLPLRNPLVVASYASTMAAVTGHRFTLGIGRGVGPLADRTGIPRLNFKLLEDYVTILRRLWRGETVNYEGPAGKLTNIGLGMALDTTPPIIMAAEGDKTFEWAGRHCDGVLTNSLWSSEAIAHSAACVRRGAEQAGRDPDEVKIWSVQVTACETSEEDFLNFIIRRMNTYILFPAFVDSLCKYNGWDPAVVKKLQQALAEIDGNSGSKGLGDEHTSRDLDALRRMRDLYPDEWIYRCNAVGDAETCAKVTRERLEAGADGIVFHGSPPKKLAPLLKVWPDFRPAEKFASRSVNPGL